MFTGWLRYSHGEKTQICSLIWTPWISPGNYIILWLYNSSNKEVHRPSRLFSFILMSWGSWVLLDNLVSKGLMPSVTLCRLCQGLEDFLAPKVHVFYETLGIQQLYGSLNSRQERLNHLLGKGKTALEIPSCCLSISTLLCLKISYNGLKTAINGCDDYSLRQSCPYLIFLSIQ